MSDLYAEIQETPDSRPFADRALSHLNVRYTITQGNLDAIPREGPLLIVANHPFGGVEGLILLSLLNAVRPDIKLLANQVLSGIPELHRHTILVDLLGDSTATARNAAPVRQSLRWLKHGGALGLFPSGEVAHLNLARRRICESDWHETVARLARHSGASVLPVFFEGANGPLFQMAGLIHPRLRTALLAREIINKAGRRLPLQALAARLLIRPLNSSGNQDSPPAEYGSRHGAQRGRGEGGKMLRDFIEWRVPHSIKSRNTSPGGKSENPCTTPAQVFLQKRRGVYFLHMYSCGKINATFSSV